MKQCVLAAAIASLVACGGSGSGGSSSNGSNNPKTGTMNNLVGVNFRTASQSGVIGDNREFQYFDGETLTLLIGDTTIAEIPAAETISLANVFSDLPQDALSLRTALRMPEYTRVFTYSSFEKIDAFGNLYFSFTQGNYEGLHQYSNAARLLIALDDNNDLSDGADISDHATVTQGLELNLNANLYEFAEEIDVLNFQQQSGISLAMDVAEPLRQLYQLAGASFNAVRRTGLRPNTQDQGSNLGNHDYTYNDLGQMTRHDHMQSSDGVTRYNYSYHTDLGQITRRDNPTLVVTNGTVGSEDQARGRTDTNREYSDFGFLTSEISDRYENNNISVLDTKKHRTITYVNDRALPLLSRLQEDFRNADGSQNLADGTFDNSNSSRFSYNANNALQLDSWDKFSGTTPDDETEQSSKALVYDQQGFLTQLGDFNFTSAQQGENRVATNATDSYTVTETFNANGQMTSSNRTGSNPFARSYEYDDQGRLARCNISVGSDSAVMSFTYGDSGLTSLSSSSSGDSISLNFTYGSEGQLMNGGADSTLVYSAPVSNGVSYIIYEHYLDYYDRESNLFNRSIEIHSNFNLDICVPPPSAE